MSITTPSGDGLILFSTPHVARRSVVRLERGGASIGCSVGAGAARQSVVRLERGGASKLILLR